MSLILKLGWQDEKKNSATIEGAEVRDAVSKGEGWGEREADNPPQRVKSIEILMRERHRGPDQIRA